jgi:hypothetical protein
VLHVLAFEMRRSDAHGWSLHQEGTASCLGKTTLRGLLALTLSLLILPSVVVDVVVVLPSGALRSAWLGGLLGSAAQLSSGVAFRFFRFLGRRIQFKLMPWFLCAI